MQVLLVSTKEVMSIQEDHQLTESFLGLFGTQIQQPIYMKRQMLTDEDNNLNLLIQNIIQRQLLEPPVFQSKIEKNAKTLKHPFLFVRGGRPVGSSW